MFPRPQANKKLAKEVTKWVATAVQSSEGTAPGGGGAQALEALEGGGGEGDCPVS